MVSFSDSSLRQYCVTGMGFFSTFNNRHSHIWDVCQLVTFNYIVVRKTVRTSCFSSSSMAHRKMLWYLMYDLLHTEDFIIAVDCGQLMQRCHCHNYKALIMPFNSHLMINLNWMLICICGLFQQRVWCCNSLIMKTNSAHKKEKLPLCWSIKRNPCPRSVQITPTRKLQLVLMWRTNEGARLQSDMLRNSSQHYMAFTLFHWIILRSQ